MTRRPWTINYKAIWKRDAWMEQLTGRLTMRVQAAPACSEPVRHHATADFWRAYEALSSEMRTRAEEQFAFLKADPLHPSLQLKKIGARQDQELWSVRVSLNFRALAETARRFSMVLDR